MCSRSILEGQDAATNSCELYCEGTECNPTLGQGEEAWLRGWGRDVCSKVLYVSTVLLNTGTVLGASALHDEQ
jgi:hypothetical protein